MTASDTCALEPAPLASKAAAQATHDLQQVIEQACSTIAPTWPLDRLIAVNPFWGLTDQPIRDVAAKLRALSGARLLMPRAWYREERAAGRLRDEHLLAAIEQAKASVALPRLLDLLGEDEPSVARRCRVVDVADAERDAEREVSWLDFVHNSISQFCAAYFDEGQASLRPERDGGLFASWRRQAQTDKAPRLLMGLRSYATAVQALPETALELIRLALDELCIPPHERANYLAGLLLDVNGWASWCMYERWQARLQQGDDATIVDLLAVRLAWEWLLLRGRGEHFSQRWSRAMASWPAVDERARTAQAEDWLFQAAAEMAWQDSVIRDLPAGLRTAAPSQVAVQAVFCIDVRSEVFRRAFEAESEAVQTLGFAGFFGLPVEYQPAGSPSSRPQLPGLIAPRLRITDTAVNATQLARRTERLGAIKSWKAFKSGAVATFSFVEALGPTYAWELLKDSLGLRRVTARDDTGLTAEGAAARKPRITETVDGQELTTDDKSDLAAGILRGMSLTHDFARVVLLAGHGSETRNNPHAAGLDCGACCGQTGEVNARAAAALLNEASVREGLAARGIDVPQTTRFVAGLHNTTTDELTLFDLDELPTSHAEDLLALRRWLQGAGRRAREERAALLGLHGTTGADLDAAIQSRTSDWAQVRPEWGLTNNAAFIVAPREHTRHLNLKGRSFLHDYRFQEDAEFAVLEQIMTAPMVVTHWINFQYYASTVDNLRYGSGNKVLHNVVGGHLGVFEGNGGDLRIGLPLQSLHDGERWMHAPLRLTVMIEAPREAIHAVIRKHDVVKNLVENGWLHLFQIDTETQSIHSFRQNTWHQTINTEPGQNPPTFPGSPRPT